MIYIFRKEIKKWHTILWLVFISLAIGSGLSLIFWKSPHTAEDTPVAQVDGKAITVKTYKTALINLQQSIQMLQQYAKMYGMSEDAFLKSFFGKSNPHEIALNNCIKEALMNKVTNSMRVEMSTQYLHEEIIKTLPRGSVNQEGKVNMDVYKGHLQRLAKTPNEYEQEQTKAIKRKLIERVVNESFYFPTYIAKHQVENQNSVKSFVIAELPFDMFLKEVKNQAINDKELKAHYEKYKQAYVVPEKKQVYFWKISTKEYAKTINVSDESIVAFYNKNRSTTFRVPPKVNVKRIVFNVPQKATKKEREEILKKALKVHGQVKQKPQDFVAFVKDYSDDEQSLKNGGETGLFRKGSYSPQMEKAAFRLKKEGEISNLVTTGRSFEILQLKERVNASYKSLDNVKEEIRQSLRAKKSLNELKSKLNGVMHKARSNKQEIELFANNLKLNRENSAWLSSSMINTEKGITRSLAQSVFTLGKRAKNHGFFLDNDTYILYQVSDIQKSYIRKFNEVKNQVEQSYFENKARDAQQAAVKKIKSQIFTKKESNLASAAKQYSVSKITKASKKDSIKHFEHDKNIKDRVFALSSTGQILQYKKNNDIYLIQFEKSEPLSSSDTFLSEIKSFAKSENMKGSQIQSAAFIASLQRNAKIDIDKKILRIGGSV